MDKDTLRSMISEITKELDSLSALKNEMNEIKTETSRIFKRSMDSILHEPDPFIREIIVKGKRIA